MAKKTSQRVVDQAIHTFLPRIIEAIYDMMAPDVVKRLLESRDLSILIGALPVGVETILEPIVGKMKEGWLKNALTEYGEDIGDEFFETLGRISHERSKGEKAAKGASTTGGSKPIFNFWGTLAEPETVYDEDCPAKHHLIMVFEHDGGQGRKQQRRKPVVLDGWFRIPTDRVFYGKLQPPLAIKLGCVCADTVNRAKAAFVEDLRSREKASVPKRSLITLADIERVIKKIGGGVKRVGSRIAEFDHNLDATDKVTAEALDLRLEVMDFADTHDVKLESVRVAKGKQRVEQVTREDVQDYLFVACAQAHNLRPEEVTNTMFDVYCARRRTQKTIKPERKVGLFRRLLKI